LICSIFQVERLYTYPVMKPSFILFLLCQDAVNGFMPYKPSAAIQKKTTILAMSDGAGDDYDDWFADFDPSQFESNDQDKGSSSSRAADHDYSRDTVDMSNVDLNTVNYLISERLYMRKTGKFDQADAMRDELMEKHGVMIRDKERVWRSGCSASGSGTRWSPGNQGRGGYNQRGGGYNQRGGGDNRGRGRGYRKSDFGPNGHDYNMARGAGPIQSTLSEDEIHALLAERLECKLARDYPTADEIQAELIEAGVNVNDKQKEWRADGATFADFTARKYVESPNSSSEDADEIQVLVDERAAAKSERLYQKADAIRDELTDKFDVVIDDRRLQWSVGGDFGFDQRNERKDRFEPFTMSPGFSSVEDSDEIQKLVEERDVARSNREYDVADQIRDELKERNIFVDDRKRQWSVGRNFGEDRRTYSRRGGGDISEEDEKEITGLLAKRFEHKKNRKFKSADAIRDRLRDDFHVQIDDRNQEWHVVNENYVMAPGSALLDSETQETIEEMVNQRADAKLKKDYETADSIRDVLMDRYSVSIDDRVKEWTKLDVTRTNDDGELGGKDDFKVSIESEDASEDADTLDKLDDLLDDMVSEKPEESAEGELAKSAEDLGKLTVPELKERLREQNLPVSGRKSELIERLMA
jgi:cysteinyl-tRNA synthetase